MSYEKNILLLLSCPQTMFLEVSNNKKLVFSQKDLVELQNYLPMSGAYFFLSNRAKQLSLELCNDDLVNHHILHKMIAVKELVALRNAFIKFDIQHIFLKGLAQEYLLYGKDMGRSMRDIDILIPSSKMALAVEELCANGYYPVDSKDHKPISEYEALNQITRHIILKPTHGRFEVELHYSFSNNFSSRLVRDDDYFEYFHNGIQTIKILNNNIVTMDLCNTFIVAAFHLYLHLNNISKILINDHIPISFFIDFWEIMYQVDKNQQWDTVLDRLKIHTYKSRVFIMMAWLRELTGWTTPAIDSILDDCGLNTDSTKIITQYYEGQGDVIVGYWKLNVIDRIKKYNAATDVVCIQSFERG